MFRVLLLLFLLLASPSYALTDTGDVAVSASIGENEVTIFGFTSPISRVELTGINIYAMTYSQQNGFFEFSRQVLPKNPNELCLQSKDTYNRSSTLVCIPPPPATNYHTDIGPIILPPTISLEQNIINPNSTVISSGQSIPKSPITIFFYKVTDSAKSFPKAALAYSLPPLTTVTDENGDYSLNLPTAYSSNYRLYSSVEFDQSNSPKSNTLFYFLPKTYNYLMIYIFILTIIIFLLLLFLNSNAYHRIKVRFLPALRTSYPAIYPDHLPRTLKIPR